MTDKKRIKELEKKIIKLEKQIALKDSLIELLRVLPGNKHIKLGLTKEGKKKDVSKRTQGKSRLAATAVPSEREPTVDSKATGGHDQNLAPLE